MQATISFNRKDLCALGVLCLFCLYLFRDIVFSGHLLIGDDFVTFYLGMKRFLYDEVRLHHDIPFWNPYLFGGMPFWAHFESTIFYPLGFLFYLVSPEKAYGYTMFLHLVLAGAFMYLLARSLGFTEFGSFVAGSIFTCNGFVMAILFLGHMSPMESYIWLPLVIYFVNRASISPKPLVSAMTAGGLWGVQILAGAPQDAFYTFLATNLFLLCTIRGGKDIRRSSARQLVIAITVFLIGAGVSCIQILPAFELINESVRASLDTYEWATLASYPLEGIITILLPHFFGNYADGSLWVGNTPWSIPHQNLYTGIFSVILIGFVSLRRKTETRALVFALALAILSLLLCFGHHTPIYRLIYVLPGFDRFRAPSKIMVLWVFSIALLAGAGMGSLPRHIREKRIRRLYPLFLLVLCLVGLDLLLRFDPSWVLRIFSPFVLDEALPGKMGDAQGIIVSELHRLVLFSSLFLLVILLIKRSILPFSIGISLLCAFLLVDLGFVHGKAIRHDDSTYERIAEIKRDLNASLARDKTLYRVGTFQHTLGANLEMFMGYQTVGGFSALFPGRYYEYMDKYADYRLPRGWVSFFYGISKNHVLMDLLNVKYEISYTDKSIGFRDTCLPRAFLVPSAKVVAKKEILDRLTSPDFDPLSTVLIEEEGKVPVRSMEGPYTKARVDIIDYAPDRILLDADSLSPGYLLLSEIFYPGWKAYIDDRPATIMRGNFLFRVIPLPEGRHKIRLHYDPLTIKLGIGVTVFTLLVILGTQVCFFRRKRIPAKR
ncbi:MAG: YfhO family protein [Pseudomonadota bacterium]